MINSTFEISCDFNEATYIITYLGKENNLIDEMYRNMSACLDLYNTPQNMCSYQSTCDELSNRIKHM